MASLSLLTLDALPKVLPVAVAVVASTRLLLTEKSLVTVVLGSTNAKSKAFTVHTSKTTTLFSEDRSYSHSGLNE